MVTVNGYRELLFGHAALSKRVNDKICITKRSSRAPCNTGFMDTMSVPALRALMYYLYISISMATSHATQSMHYGANLRVPKYGTSLEPVYIIDLTSSPLRLDHDHHLTVFNVWVYNLLSIVSSLKKKFI